jgi:hypothetical protein
MLTQRGQEGCGHGFQRIIARSHGGEFEPPVRVGVSGGHDAEIGAQQLHHSPNLRHASRIAHCSAYQRRRRSVGRSNAQRDQHGEPRQMNPAHHHIRKSGARLRFWLQTTFKLTRDGPKSTVRSRLDAPDHYYSTTKGADCAISCFEISSLTLIVTLYFPG